MFLNDSMATLSQLYHRWVLVCVAASKAVDVEILAFGVGALLEQVQFGPQCIEASANGRLRVARHQLVIEAIAFLEPLPFETTIRWRCAQMPSVYGLLSQTGACAEFHR
jgi:hypothetical protein